MKTQLRLEAVSRDHLRSLGDRVGKLQLQLRGRDHISAFRDSRKGFQKQGMDIFYQKFQKTKV